MNTLYLDAESINAGESDISTVYELSIECNGISFILDETLDPEVAAEAFLAGFNNAMNTYENGELNELNEIDNYLNEW